MRSLQMTAPHRVALTETAEPVGDIIVRAETMGICGTDLKVLHGAVPVTVPRTLGHEMVGRVVTSSDPSLPPGRRVLLDPALVCGDCGPCRRNRPNLCVRGGLMGRETDGVFAELTAVDAARLLVVPEQIDPTSTGLLQVLGTCVHGLSSVDLVSGAVAVVIGLGVAGQLMTRLLMNAGLTVIGVSRSTHKRELAAAHGVQAVEPSGARNLLGELAGVEGPALVVEAVGTEATLADAIELAGIGGEIVAFGITGSGHNGLPYYQLYFKELTIRSPRAATRADYARAIELVASEKIKVGDLVTHSVSLNESSAAFDLAERPSSLKVLITA